MSHQLLKHLLRSTQQLACYIAREMVGVASRETRQGLVYDLPLLPGARLGAKLRQFLQHEH